MELNIVGKEGEGKTAALNICLEALTKAGYKCNINSFRRVTKDIIEESFLFDKGD